MKRPVDIDALEESLAQAERNLQCAGMIDNEQRRAAQVAYWRGRVDGLKRRLADETGDGFTPREV